MARKTGFGCKQENIMMHNEQKTGKMMDEIAKCSYNPLGNLTQTAVKGKRRF